MLRTFSLLLLILSFFSVFSQEEYFVGQSRFLQKTNASFFGFNNLSRVGVLYNTLSVNSEKNIDNKYFFGALSFDEKKFSIGLDVNSFEIQNTGLTNTTVNFSYVYKIQVKDGVFLLPALTAGFTSSKFNTSSFIFEDQLNKTTGFINTETIDPLGESTFDINYFDLGASFILHSDTFLVGLSLKHLNQPNVSYNNETTLKKPIRITLNGGYEFNINTLERGFLPDDSYLYIFSTVSHFNSNYYLFLSQELQLGEFSIGINQQASMVKKFNLNNIGASVGISLENFDFGLSYNFPMRTTQNVFAPSIFEVYITFDFSIYRRNGRGLFKRLQIDNYF